MIATHTAGSKGITVKPQATGKAEASEAFLLLDPGSALPGYFTLTFTTTYCNDDMKFFKFLHGKCSRSLGCFQIPILKPPAFCSKPKWRDVQTFVIPLVPN